MSTHYLDGHVRSPEVRSQISSTRVDVQSNSSTGDRAEIARSSHERTSGLRSSMAYRNIRDLVLDRCSWSLAASETMFLAVDRKRRRSLILVGKWSCTIPETRGP